MSLAQLREDFANVAQDLPPAPKFVRTAANDNDANLLKIFERDVSYYNSQIDSWYDRALKNVACMRKVFEMAHTENPEYAVLLLDLLNSVDQNVDLMVSYAKDMLEPPAETKATLDKAANINRHARRVVQKAEEMYKKAMLRFYQYVLDIKDEVNILTWDYDPEARGGVVFDNADDLIAHLNAL